MIDLKQPSIKDHFSILIPDTDSNFIELMSGNYKIGESNPWQLMVTSELYIANKKYFDSIAPNKPDFKGLPLDYYKPKESEYQNIKKLYAKNNKIQIKQYMYIVPMKLTKKMLEYLNSL